jgi:phosphatidate cytidylyltransferase
MSDLHSINEAINKKAGRKLLPSIAVGLSLIALVWFTLSYQREIFAIVVAIAVILGLRELVRAFAARGIVISFNALTLAAIGLSYAAWVGGVAGLAVATAIAFPLLLIRALLQGPDGFVAKGNGNNFWTSVLTVFGRIFDFASSSKYRFSTSNDFYGFSWM